MAEELKRLSDARVRHGRHARRHRHAAPRRATGSSGFLACWDERVQEAFASDEIAALLEVADRCALVIENSKLYQQMKERDRLAALGEMSAGLAHEIRNPLAAIKGAIQYLDPSKLPAEDREFLGDHGRRGEPPEQRRHPVPRLLAAAEPALAPRR